MPAILLSIWMHMDKPIKESMSGLDDKPSALPGSTASAMAEQCDLPAELVDKNQTVRQQ